MDVQVQAIDEITVLAVSGEVDGGTAPTLQEHVLAAAQPNCKMLLDMSQVEFMSSAGLRVMLLLYRQISSGNGRVVLAGLSDEIKNTMAATGFLKYFTTADNVASGLAALRQ